MKTITIGIPVYNEESNILNLINSILKQKIDNFYINKIIISSDGSNDHTVKICKSIKNNKIKIIDNKNRKGIARGLNQIISSSKSEILVTLDGDIDIKDKQFLKKLIDPIINKNADLTSSAILEKFPGNFYGKVIYVSMLLKTELFKNFKNGNNVYTCHGLARAYSKNFYTKLHFPLSVGNDMYSYLKCVKDGLKYVYSENAIVWYRVPESYNDHKKQSTRFFNTIEAQDKYFDSNFVEKETKINMSDYILAGYKALHIIFQYPVHSFAFFFIQLYLRFKSTNDKTDEAWTIALSTKKYE